MQWWQKRSANVTSDAKTFCEEDIPVGACESRSRLLDHNRVVRQAQIAPDGMLLPACGSASASDMRTPQLLTRGGRLASGLDEN
jgi:hypothetical protein